MRRITPAVVMLIVGTLVTGCGGGADTHDKVAADMVKNLQTIVRVLQSVTDKNTSEAAAKQIRALGASMESAQDRFNALGKPSKEIGDDLNSKYGAQINKARNDIVAERDRITKLGPDVLEPVNAAMRAAMKVPAGPTTR
jgi:hypothetical protein